MESFDQVPQLALFLRIRRLVNFVKYQLGDEDVILVQAGPERFGLALAVRVFRVKDGIRNRGVQVDP